MIIVTDILELNKYGIVTLMDTHYDGVLCLLILPVLTSTTLCANTL